MCDECRERHRTYSSTKRAKRKMEKGSVTTAGFLIESPMVGRSDGREQSSVMDATEQEEPSFNEFESLPTAAQSAVTPSVDDFGSGTTEVNPLYASGWFGIGGDILHKSLSASPNPWYQALDPHFLAQDATISLEASPISSSLANSYPQTAYLASQQRMMASNASSSLANALVMPVATQQQRFESPPPPFTPSMANEDKSLEDSTISAGATDGNGRSRDSTSQLRSTLISPGAEDALGVSEQPEPEGPMQQCSVRGCKKLLPVSYELKMCPPCRSRYQKYGTTKRAKWKASREAFNKELAALRATEDERRERIGLLPLSECPHELLAWEHRHRQLPEQSELGTPAPSSPSRQGTPYGVSDAQRATTTSTSLSISSSPPLQPLSITAHGALLVPHFSLTKSTQNATFMSVPIVGNETYPASDSIHASPSASSTLIPPPSSSIYQPKPPRICTVSHCRAVLPEEYQFKRCEPHRLQNRLCTRRKTLRDKMAKGIVTSDDVNPGQNGVGDLLVIQSAMSPANRAGEIDSTAVNSANANIPPKKRKRFDGAPRFSCEECENLLGPGYRWRTCQECRGRAVLVKKLEREATNPGSVVENTEGGKKRRKRSQPKGKDEAPQSQHVFAEVEPDEGQDAEAEKVDAVLQPASSTGSLKQPSNTSISAPLMTTNTPQVIPIPSAPPSNTSKFRVAPQNPDPTTSATSFLMPSFHRSTLISWPGHVPSSSLHSAQAHSVTNAARVGFTYGGTSGMYGMQDKKLTEEDLEKIKALASGSASCAGETTDKDNFSSDPTASTVANAQSGPAFGGYIPSTAQSAVGRLLASNPGLGVDVFVESGVLGDGPKKLDDAEVEEDSEASGDDGMDAGPEKCYNGATQPDVQAEEHPTPMNATQPDVLVLAEKRHTPTHAPSPPESSQQSEPHAEAPMAEEAASERVAEATAKKAHPNFQASVSKSKRTPSKNPHTAPRMPTTAAVQSATNIPPLVYSAPYSYSYPSYNYYYPPHTYPPPYPYPYAPSTQPAQTFAATTSSTSNVTKSKPKAQNNSNKAISIVSPPAFSPDHGYPGLPPGYHYDCASAVYAYPYATPPTGYPGYYQYQHYSYPPPYGPYSAPAQPDSAPAAPSTASIIPKLSSQPSTKSSSDASPISSTVQSTPSNSSQTSSNKVDLYNPPSNQVANPQSFGHTVGTAIVSYYPNMEESLQAPELATRWQKSMGVKKQTRKRKSKEVTQETEDETEKQKTDEEQSSTTMGEKPQTYILASPREQAPFLPQPPQLVFYHYGSMNPDLGKKRRKVDPRWKEKLNEYQAQTNQERDTGSTVAEGSPGSSLSLCHSSVTVSTISRPVDGPVTDSAASVCNQPETHSQFRVCNNGSCHRSLPSASASSICEKCKTKFKKKQDRAKLKFKLVPKPSAINKLEQRAKRGDE
ncbi:hypothetical protein CPB83DRAFT_838329 [Crepidotus variabilis]|uniref:Uncharacterized protein n=1 Tax=Crepidotus variabilis TaxID=179855 RepID=A0A9P6JM17_9AGAR|nr:hypothetical protein CPB83DRAFT_838329 [Crepidotus variabilis]